MSAALNAECSYDVCVNIMHAYYFYLENIFLYTNSITYAGKDTFVGIKLINRK